MRYTMGTTNSKPLVSMGYKSVVPAPPPGTMFPGTPERSSSSSFSLSGLAPVHYCIRLYLLVLPGVLPAEVSSWPVVPM